MVSVSANGEGKFDPTTSHFSLGQFTSEAFTDMLGAQGVKIRMDGKGRWIDNVFIERL